jgi:hypothetical protein
LCSAICACWVIRLGRVAHAAARGASAAGVAIYIYIAAVCPNTYSTLPSIGANVLNKRASLQNSCPILNRNARCFASPRIMNDWPNRLSCGREGNRNLRGESRQDQGGVHAHRAASRPSLLGRGFTSAGGARRVIYLLLSSTHPLRLIDHRHSPSSARRGILTIVFDRLNDALK